VVIDGENRGTWKETCRSATKIIPYWGDLGLIPGLRGENSEPVAIRLKYDTAHYNNVTLSLRNISQ
jgi:hypothetical protein